MAITIVTSADAGVPSLTNAVGSMVALLDYLLVTKLGWTKPFTGTNKAAFKQPAGTNGFYVRIEDLTTATNSPTIRGFETMTDVDNGTGPFPGPAHVGTAFPTMNKSQSSTPCGWFFISNGKMWYLCVCYSTTAAQIMNSGGSLYGFGDIKSNIPGDGYHTMVLASASTGGDNTGTGGVTLTQGSTAWVNTTSFSGIAGNWIARRYTQFGGAQNMTKFTDFHLGGATANMGAGNLPYPDPVTNSLRMSRVNVAEPNCVRGYLPGVWSHNHLYNYTQLTTPAIQYFPGSGDTAGKTFVMLYFSACSVIFETSDTWDT